MENGQHTYEEIISQPGVWGKTLEILTCQSRTEFPQFKEYDLILFTGCGSTYYLSIWAARLCEEETGQSCSAVPASELILHPNAWYPQGKKCLLVAISRSARTTETIMAAKLFQSLSIGDSIVITCYPENELAMLTPWVIGFPESREVSVAQTRSFSSMMFAVMWLIYGNTTGESSEKIVQAAIEFLDTNHALAKEIGSDLNLTKFFFLGSGPLYGIACEAMLKMKEMSLSASEAYHVMEFRHGPMSIVDQNSLVIGMLSENASDYELAVLNDMKSHGARILVLCDEAVAKKMISFSPVIISSDLDKWNFPFYLPLLQLIAFERAIHKGLNPDHPTNLSSVVVLDE